MITVVILVLALAMNVVIVTCSPNEGNSNLIHQIPCFLAGHPGLWLREPPTDCTRLLQVETPVNAKQGQGSARGPARAQCNTA